MTIDLQRDTLYPSTSDMNMPKTHHVSSRLAKTEQKKVVQQTVLLSLGAIALFLTFLFVILPGLIRFLTAVIGTQTIIQSDDTLPPQVPILAAPVAATYSAQLKLTGYGEASSELVILLNAAELTRQKIADDGSFEVELTVPDGDNTLAAYAIDAAGNQSATSREYAVKIDQEKPTIEVSEPQNGVQIESRKNQLLTIKGTTEKKAKVYINGRITYADAEGLFHTTYQLSEGENKLEIRAEDEAGNQTQTELIVTFKL